jgi:hypothetical protein
MRQSIDGAEPAFRGRLELMRYWQGVEKRSLLVP